MKISNTSERLKEIMKENNYRQIDIINKCIPYCNKYNIKLGRNDLSQYVNKKVEPGQEKLSILGMALGVNEAWLMGYDVPKNRTQIIHTEHKEMENSILYAIKELASESGYDFSFFANQYQIVFNDCIIKLSPLEVSDLAESSVEQIRFVMKSIIDNKLKDNIVSIHSDLRANAAHDRTDIEVTEEMKKNDDAFFDED